MLYTNILATDYMAATYRGKLVTSEQNGLKAITPPQTRVDWLIENNMTFGQSEYAHNIGFLVAKMRFEDGTEVTSQDCIDASQVPSDAELFIGFEPKFYLANQ